MERSICVSGSSVFLLTEGTWSILPPSTGFLTRLIYMLPQDIQHTQACCHLFHFYSACAQNKNALLSFALCLFYVVYGNTQNTCSSLCSHFQDVSLFPNTVSLTRTDGHVYCRIWCTFSSSLPQKHLNVFYFKYQLTRRHVIQHWTKSLFPLQFITGVHLTITVAKKEWKENKTFIYLNDHFSCKKKYKYYVQIDIRQVEKNQETRGRGSVVVWHLKNRHTSQVLSVFLIR